MGRKIWDIGNRIRLEGSCPSRVVVHVKVRQHRTMGDRGLSEHVNLYIKLKLGIFSFK